MSTQKRPTRRAAGRQRTASRIGQTDASRTDAQITDLRNKRDVIYDRLWDKTKRVRNAVKGLYGDDSSEYEMVGGKRISERKPPVRKPKTA